MSVEAETWTIHVCKDCRQMAHGPGSRCGKDRRRTWTVAETVEVTPLERAERAEAAAKDFAKALLMLEDWHGDERTYLLINEAFSRHPGLEIPAPSEAERDGGQA